MVQRTTILEIDDSKPKMATPDFRRCSKITCGLEPVQLTQAMMEKNDSFQLRCLRKFSESGGIHRYS